MSNEDLLKPRYKVIAGYPRNVTSVGEVLFIRPHQESVDVKLWMSRHDEFPHLFKKMKWWEERAKEEMPKFLKLFYNDKTQYVHKVENWTGENSEGQPLYEYFNRKKYLSTACVSELLPAIEEEYNEYCQTYRVIEQ